MKKSIIKALSLILALVTILSIGVIPAMADSIPSPSSNSPIKGYPIATSGKVYCYADSSLNSRGRGWIWWSDECYIIEIGNNGRAIYASYPLDNGGRTARWFDASDFFPVHTLDGGLTAVETTKEITTYKHADGLDRYGYTGAYDICYITGSKGSYTNVLYPLSRGGFKSGWVKTSDLQNGSRTPGGNTPTTGNSSKISFSYSSSGSYTSSKSSSVDLRVNGTTINVGGTFYTYNSSGTKSTGYSGGYRYVKVGDRLIDVGSGQCLAYARYLQILLYGTSEFSSPSKFRTVVGRTQINTSTAKQYITAAGAGAHIRTLNPHSLVVLAVENGGFYATDANADWANGIRIIHFSWDGFASSSYAKSGIEYIKAYQG